MAIILVLFYVYFASLHVSVAGMELLANLVLIPTLIIAIRQKKIIRPSLPVLIAFGGLLSVAIISFCINIQRWDEFGEYVREFRWMLTFFMWLQFFGLFYQRIHFPKLVLTGQITLIIAGFYSFYQFFTAHDPFRKHVVFHYIYVGSPYWRPNSFFGLPTTYAYASAMFFCISLAFLMREPRPKSAWDRRIRGLYFFISPVNIFLTFTRAAWIAFFASTLTILRLTKKQFAVRIFLVFAISFAALYTSFPSFTNRINSMFDMHYVANENRIYLWKANWDIFKENPVFGLGFEENRLQIDKYLTPYNMPHVMRNHPHNTYLNFLAGVGFTGFAFFMLFLLYNLKSTIQGIRQTTNHLHKTLFIGALGLQMVLLIGGFTECTFEDGELAHQYILFTALVEFLKGNYTQPNIKSA